MAKQDDYVRYTIRVPTDLYDRIKAAAGEKSVNAEIVAALEEKFPAPAPALEFDLQDFFDRWSKIILAAKTISDRDELIERANAQLHEKIKNMHIGATEVDGVPGVYLNFLEPGPPQRGK